MDGFGGGRERVGPDGVMEHPLEARGGAPGHDVPLVTLFRCDGSCSWLPGRFPEAADPPVRFGAKWFSRLEMGRAGWVRSASCARSGRRTGRRQVPRNLSG